MQVVINKCFGGFGLSEKALEMYQELSGKDCCSYDIERTDPILIKVVKTLGKDANNRFSELKIVDIPDDVEYYIGDYDGIETIHETHRSWG